MGGKYNIVHGHTPMIVPDCKFCGAVPGKIFFTPKDINVDCGEVFRGHRHKEGNLGSIRLEDLEEFYVRNIKGKKHYNEDLNQQRKEELRLL